MRSRGHRARGFLEVVKDRSWLNYGREAYVVPREMGELIGTLRSQLLLAQAIRLKIGLLEVDVVSARSRTQIKHSRKQQHRRTAE